MPQALRFLHKITNPGIGDRLETSRGLAAVPGAHLYDRSNCMDSAMIWMCQNCCAQIVVVK